MSYQALYRVWRPQTFDELVGQEMIAQTLKNAISHQQLSHAYLFTGPRGTGKTSAAKILAKAVNCLNPQEGNPCNECEICQLANRNQLSDVIEIDAASNNGVEEIRELRDKVRYAPTQAKYKVYIIDEVHMLTTGAFNALLKTLEEPPENVLFILATTEPHKIPATIISRTQRFDFQRIKDSDLIGRMKEVLAHEDKDYEEEALAIIARAANGGMRDSLSLLDQALSFSPEALSAETARQVSGSLDQAVYVDYTLELYHHQAEAALEILHAQFRQGKQAMRFIEELILFARDILLTQATKDNQTLLEEAEIQPLLEAVPADFYYELIDQLNQAQAQMRYSTQLDLYLEVMTIQVAQRPDQVTVTKEAGPDPDSPDFQALQEQVLKLEGQVAALSSQLEGQDQRLEEVQKQSRQVDNQFEAEESEPKPPAKPRQRPPQLTPDYQVQEQAVFRVLNEATHEDKQSLERAWNELLHRIAPRERAPLTHAQVLAVGSTYGLLGFENASYASLFQAEAKYGQALDAASQDLLKSSREWTVITLKDWSDLRQAYVKERQANQNQAVPIDQDQLAQELGSPSEEPPERDQEEASGQEEPAPTPDKEEAPPSSSSSEDPPKSQAPQPIQEVLRDSDQSLDEAPDLEEAPPEPEIVQQAAAIFGRDNINVYTDR